MLSWSSRKRLVYFFIVLAAFLFMVSIPVYFYFTKPGSCFDNVQNNGEQGVDCGGACEHLCDFQATDLVVRWARILEVRKGFIDAVALVENSNFHAGVKTIAYTFKIYDSAGNFIVDRKGETFINPNEQFVVFEPTISVGEREPARVIFEFDEAPYWVRARGIKPELTIKNKLVEQLETAPRLRATVINQSLNTLQKVFVTGLLLNKNESVVAVSTTLADRLAPNTARDIIFTWPAPFKEKPQVCLNPLDVMLVFDRSGSMNDDGDAPPQPLTDARNAAATFIDKLDIPDQVGLVSFATKATEPIDHVLTKEKEKARAAVTRIAIEPADEVGFTNLGDAIEKATFELNSTRHNIEARKVMIILTDGLANYPEIPGGEAYAEEKAALAKASGITMYAIGLGDAVNTAFLATKIASGAGRYYAAPRRSDLVRIYNEIAQVVCPEKTYIITILPRINTFDPQER